ncbi:MAG: LamG domain-containing protein [Dehalococcoidales bacterium]|nr:LamG domain-containing protein [Dehalococcoidales bacterium]
MRIYFRYNLDNTFKFGFQGDDLDYANPSADVGVWTHWVGTYDAAGNTRKLFKNGTLVASDAPTQDYQGTGAVEIGRKNDGGQYWKGLIVLPRINNRALSALEVQNSFNRDKNLVRGY